MLAEVEWYTAAIFVQTKENLNRLRFPQCNHCKDAHTSVTDTLAWQNPAPVPLQDSHIILAMGIKAGREVALCATIIETNSPGHQAADCEYASLQTCLYGSPLWGKTVGFVNADSSKAFKRRFEMYVGER